MIGLLGGIASGKSLVAGQLQDLGAGLLDGDLTGHEVLRMPDIEQAARQRWGTSILTTEGRIDRGKLAALVFAAEPSGPRELEFLEQLTHPRIGQLLREKACDMAASGQYQAIVLDAPVMLKAGWHTICNRIVFVDAPREVRLARALRRGWTEAEFTAREARQESLDVKRRHADTLIDNSGPADSTRFQVQQFWRNLIG